MTELKIMGFALGAIVVAIILFAIIGAIRKATLKKKNTAKLAEIMLKKDLSSKCSRCTFYMNNDYNNGYSQSEWLKIFKESVIDKEWDKDSEEYAEAVAPFINAIVNGKERPHYRSSEVLCSRYLSSRAVARQVLSAYMSLTSVFGMGTGGPS